MSPYDRALLRGKSDYQRGVSIDDCPYPDDNEDDNLKSHWVEGYQMAAYEEKQASISVVTH